MRFLCATAILLIGLAAGCNNPAPSGPEMPLLDQQAAIARALGDFDRDGSRSLSQQEVQSSPGFTAAFARYDRDGNGEINEAELQVRLDAYNDVGLAIFPWTCQVLLNGQPLADATVTLVPEGMFVGFPPATGTTDGNGTARPAIDEERFGPQYGLYRIQISKKNSSGAETLPPKYNLQTQLGQEFAGDAPGVERMRVLELSSH